MAIKVKNNKVGGSPPSPVDDTWMGQFIVGAAEFTVPEYRLAQWRSDSKVTTDIASGDLQVVREDGPPIIYYNAVDAQRALDGYPSNLASTRGAFNVIVFAKKETTGTINKGIPVHISGYDVTNDVYLVEVADSDTSSFPAAGVVCTTNLSDVDVGHVVINGRLEKYNTSSWTDGDELYVSSSGTLTSTRPTGITNKVQRMGQVLHSHATDGVVGIMGANRANDVPNITDGKVLMGDGSDLPIEVDVYTEAEADSLLAVKITAVVDDTTPQLGGMLDVNGNSLGDGTNALLTFVEDGSAVNNIEIENQATGSGPILRAVGTDSDIDLVLDTKGTGDIDASTNKIINVVDPTAAQDAATKNYVDTLPAGATSKQMNSWTLLSGSLYYNDFTHNLSTNEVTAFLYDTVTKKEVRGEYIEIIDTNTIRVVVEGNTEDLTCNVVTGRGPTGPTGAQGPAGGGLTDVVNDTTPQLGGDLDVNQKNIQYSVPAGDLTTSGIIVTATVDTNATGFGAALYMAADGNFDEADADASTTMPCRALAAETGTGSKKVILQGFIRKNAWAWTPGSDLYIDITTGALTHTAPSGTGDQVQKVGFAWTADIIYVNPGDYTIVEIA